MGWSKFTLQYSLSKFKVSQTLLVPLQHIHTAPEIVVYSGRVYSVSTESLLPDLTGFEVATEGPGRFVHVIEN